MPKINANNRVVQILIERDGASLEDAIEQVKMAQEEMMENIDTEDPEEILLDNLGLEPDYLFDII